MWGNFKYLWLVLITLFNGGLKFERQFHHIGLPRSMTGRMPWWQPICSIDRVLPFYEGHRIPCWDSSRIGGRSFCGNRDHSMESRTSLSLLSCVLSGTEGFPMHPSAYWTEMGRNTYCRRSNQTTDAWGTFAHSNLQLYICP